MAEQAASRLVGDHDAAEVASVDAGDAVVPGQAFVHERVIGCQQIDDAAVLAHDAVEEQLGFPLE